MTNPETSSKPRWFTIKEAADYLDIGEPTLYRWMRERLITFRKVGDSTRFLEEDLQDAIQVHWSQRMSERVRQTCPICRNDTVISGHIQSTGRIHFRPAHAKFWTLKEASIEVSARMCERCGAVSLFGDAERLNALRKKP